MKILSVLILCLVASTWAQTLSGEEILRKVDETITADTRIVESKMIIHGRRSSRSIESKSWIEGVEKSFTEYLAPAREQGTKMLKLEDQLWTYSPQTDRIIKISGHMLRQSVMGSDLSYEDMMEDPHLQNLYSAEVAGEEIIDNRLCWILELVAKQSDINYYSRKIWVDKERFLPLKEDLFAKSGKLLKSTLVKDVEKQSGRWIAKRILFKDQLQNGQGTEFVIESVQFNVDIPDYIFTKAGLKK